MRKSIVWSMNIFCPEFLNVQICGKGMYGNVNRKKKKTEHFIRIIFIMPCKHRRLVDGHNCSYRKQWSEDKVNDAVEEVIRKLVQIPI